jgi:hypothetical protein
VPDVQVAVLEICPVRSVTSKGPRSLGELCKLGYTQARRMPKAMLRSNMILGRQHFGTSFDICEDERYGFVQVGPQGRCVNMDLI